VSVGTPGVPIGAYTRQILARLRLTSILRTNRVSLDPNVTAITSKVALGSADAGFVYTTDARAVADRTEVVALPKWAQPPVRYGMCVVRRAGVDTAAANAFIAKVRSTNGRRVLKSYGFGLPPRS
jgi:molybdate transport system substrate-binding protein